MDKEKVLIKGYDALEAGEKFYELLMKFHDNGDIDNDQLEKLVSDDVRFQELEKKMEILGNKLGM